MGWVGFYHLEADYPDFIPAILAKLYSAAIGQKED
jgi:hypothetical protein